MTMNVKEPVYRIGGYVKRAKLNLRNKEEIIAFHRGIFERRFGGFEDGTLVDVYIDITGCKETYKRPEMLRLMRDCRAILPPTQGNSVTGFILSSM